MEKVILLVRYECIYININLKQICDLMDIIHNIPFYDEEKMIFEMGLIEEGIKRFDKKYGKIFIEGKLWKIYRGIKCSKK